MGGICVSQNSHAQEDELRSDKQKTTEQQSKPQQIQESDQEKQIHQISKEQMVQQRSSKEFEEKKAGVEQDNCVVDKAVIDDMQRKKENRKKAKIAAIGDQEEIFENIIKKEKNKSPFDYQLILNAFQTHSIFNQIQQSDQEKITEKMFYCIVPDQEYVFKQGDKASTYFLIERGQCQIIINGEVKKTLKAPDAFGELALLYNAPRSASVRTVGDCAFWAIDRNTFRRVIEDISQRDYEENRLFIQKVKFFESLTEEQKDSISNVLITLIFKKGEIIVNEGDMANSFFIIKQGSVSAFKDGKELRKMEQGESFGEQALFQNSTRGATVKATDELVKCLALSREDLTRILGDKIQVIMYNNSQRWAIEKNPVLQKLTKIQIEKIINCSKTVSYKSGDIVFKKNESCGKLVIILEGSLIEENSKKVEAQAGQLYGHQFLRMDQQQTQMSENIIFDKEGLLTEIDLNTFFECIGGSIEQILQKNLNSHEVKYMKKNDGSAKKDYSHFDLTQFIAIKKLGAGQFGNVYLVKNKFDNKLYALKCISKVQIVEQNLEKHLLQEKKVLETVSFPLMMQFLRSFKDNNFVFFLLEYIKGMELFDVIREIGRIILIQLFQGLLNTYDSQFYLGSLILCIEYLHTNNIIYRDIKPENIMVDEKGYMKLIDMGTAKFLKGKGGRTHTIIGTPHYMAPEILTGKGYTFSVDLWSIGICLYEFMCGGVPYAEDADDPYEIYEEIIKKPLTYPSFLKDRKAKKLIDQLLCKTPEIRLGSSFASLKANSWFDHLDWDKLMDHELKPPYVPPKNKIISDKDIQKQAALGKQVTLEVQNELNVNYNPDKVHNKGWDKDY